MHGYLNVFLAAAFLVQGMSDADLLALLEETDSGAFHVRDDGVSWRDNSLDAAQLTSARETLALSFGSCSFAEPVADARKLDLV